MSGSTGCPLRLLRPSAPGKQVITRVHLVNPSDNSFGTAVITPRWLFVLAAATPDSAGDPILIDESLDQIVPESIQPGISSASAFIPATPCADTRLAAWRESAAHGWYTAAFTPHSFQRKR